ncbi:lytic transglycosylase domain-containing protein [uncultured Sphingomonas sp.]|uniref:lytic transglycosylase domain-containing protein n=1 Tax=uncultured Sphingomonas sp. TaxID=158754 RepID=UPI0035C976B4
MLGAGWRIGVMGAAALAGVGASGMQDDLERYRQQLATMTPRSPAPADAAIAAAYAQWKAVSATGQLPFDSYATFLLAHPGWPGEADLRHAAEAKAALASPGAVVGFFRAFTPLTQGGRVAYARALLATGAPGEAAEQARAAWRRGALLAADEGWVAQSFAGRLTAADQDARMDTLLWAGQTAAAARQLALVTSAARGVFAARLALRGNAPEAAGIAMAGTQPYDADAGYVADRALWLAKANAAPTARAWLAAPHALAAPPGDPDRYMDVLLAHARGAAADGNWQQAYDIARQADGAYDPGTDVTTRPYGERDAYTDLAWLAAQAAYRHLGRPADAATLFDRYGHGSATPSVRSKGLYWAARAADAAGSPQAAGFWQAAAGYRDQYYGQLALEHLGRPLAAPPPLAPVAVDAMTRLAFNSRDTVRAAQMLGNIGAYDDQTAFVRQIAMDAKSDTDHLLAAELARQLQRPDLGVMVGRSALLNGLSDYSAAGFPTVPVPAGYEGDWTIIHAIARQESQFNRAAVSHAGARGLMQLMPATAREQGGKIGLTFQPAALTTDPNLSIMLGSTYFRHIFGLYGSYPLAVAAYNAGPGNVNRWLAANGDPRTGTIDMVDWVEAIPIGETRNYVQRVLENAVVYDLLRPERALSRGPANLSWYLGRRPG